MSDEVLANIETCTGKCSSTVGERRGGGARRVLIDPGAVLSAGVPFLANGFSR